VHPGFRWSEQVGLRWADVNFLKRVDHGQPIEGRALAVPAEL
jgi:hypothetical protein